MKFNTFPFNEVRVEKASINFFLSISDMFMIGAVPKINYTL